jgi:predicted dehydrogenase
VAHSRLTRRSFLRGAGGSLAALAGARVPHLRRPSDELGVAVVGLNGRGMDHLEALRALPGVRIVALCDVDDLVLSRAAKKLREHELRADGHADFRNVLERKDVDAVSIATPNHWHALQAIWACQAGKDVYVEKPVTHAFGEGAPLVAAAQKYGRMVQCGMQSRTSPAIREALEWVRAGNLGALQLARGLCYKPRPSIGKCKGNQKIPDSVDYDLWCGPAPLVPLRRQRLHYDWHWSFATGDGDLGNQGVHQLDLARWALGAEKLPPSVLSLGARLGYEDDGETPNTQMVFLTPSSPCRSCFEVRGLPRDAAAQGGDWWPAWTPSRACRSAWCCTARAARCASELHRRDRLRRRRQGSPPFRAGRRPLRRLDRGLPQPARRGPGRAARGRRALERAGAPRQRLAPRRARARPRRVFGELKSSGTLSANRRAPVHAPGRERRRSPEAQARPRPVPRRRGTQGCFRDNPPPAPCWPAAIASHSCCRPSDPNPSDRARIRVGAWPPARPVFGTCTEGPPPSRRRVRPIERAPGRPSCAPIEPRPAPTPSSRRSWAASASCGGSRPGVWARPGKAILAPAAGFVVIALWLSRFRVTMADDELVVAIPFRRARHLRRAEILSVEFAERTGPLESPVTLLIRTSGGEELRLNAKVFAPSAVQDLLALDLRTTRARKQQPIP